MQRENLEQLNAVIVQPLREALINNEHCEVFKKHSEWLIQAAAHTLKDPNLDDIKVLEQFDRYLYVILDRGQKPCNSNFLALTYSYIYLYLRINAIEKVLTELGYYLDGGEENELIVDIGCGTGALLVALHNLVKDQDFVLNYQGYDEVEQVLLVNQEIINKIYPSNEVKISGKIIESYGEADEISITRVMMVFSYVFSQDCIDELALISFKERVDSLFSEFNLQRFYILYINKDPSYYNQNYKKFISLLDEGGYKIINKRDVQPRVNNYRLYNLSTERDNLKQVPGTNYDSNIHGTLVEIERV